MHNDTKNLSPNDKPQARPAILHGLIGEKYEIFGEKLAQTADAVYKIQQAEQTAIFVENTI